jgi:hypothetical protein
MCRSKSASVFSVLLALAFGFGMPLALPGCGGGDGRPEMVKPGVTPAVAAKDSLNAYLQSSSHLKATKAKATKKHLR